MTPRIHCAGWFLKVRRSPGESGGQGWPPSPPMTRIGDCCLCAAASLSTVEVEAGFRDLGPPRRRSEWNAGRAFAIAVGLL